MASETRLSLIRLLQNQPTEAAWQEFVSLYGTMIGCWLAREGVRHMDAEDVQQEVMTAVLQNINSFEHNGRIGAFRKWLRLIAANRLRRLWASKTKQEREVCTVDLASLAGQLADDESRISVEWDREHDNYLIEKLLADLTDRFNATSLDVFRRVALQQEPAERVAKELGMTLGAVRVAQHRVLKALKAGASNAATD